MFKKRTSIISAVNEEKPMFSKRASIISAVLSIIVVIFVISVVAYQIRTNPYEEHYFEKIGFKEPQYTYAELIEDFGQPLDIQESSDFTEVRYDDFCVRLFTDNPEAGIMNVRVFGSAYRFGSKKIGVGSTKKEVSDAYKYAKKSPDTDYAYVDGKMYVQYFFDDNDIVKEILIFWYS